MMNLLAQWRARRSVAGKEQAALKRAATRAGAAMTRLAGAEDGRRISGVVAVMPYYGDDHLLAWILTYYRTLGVVFFVFLDWSEAGDLLHHLAETADCAVWRSNAGPEGGDTLHALNFLRHRYAEGKWCLSVEPFDVLVFPHSETRHIRDLIDFLENEQRSLVHAIVVDAYAGGSARAISHSDTISPDQALPYVDRLGYQTCPPTERRLLPIIGGVQRRSIYGEVPEQAPALNRIPLVKITPERYYVSSTTVMNLPELNAAHSDWHSTPTSCLLRYALLCGDSSLSLAAHVEAAQDEAGLGSLLQGSIAMTEMNLITSASAGWRSSQDLVDCGLINNGQWF
jgi:hypothetical protein